MDQDTLTRIRDLAVDYALRLLLAAIILFVGFWIAKILRSGVRRVLDRRQLEPVIGSFVSSVAYGALLMVVIIAVLRQVGVETASLVALIGATGLAIGLALQGSLANFAAGFLLILFRPFRRGHYIEGAGTAGVVEEIQIFNTILKTPDNKLVVVPNSKLTSDNLTNYSALETRRIELNFGISYDDDLNRAKAALRQVIEHEGRVLREPPLEIHVSALGDSAVNLLVRAWVRSPDYWPVTYALTEQVKLAFDAEGITIPFRQYEVRLVQEQAPATRPSRSEA